MAAAAAAAAAAAPAAPILMENNNVEPNFVFSQRGDTCGTDALFTLFEYSDVLKPNFDRMKTLIADVDTFINNWEATHGSVHMDDDNKALLAMCYQVRRSVNRNKSSLRATGLVRASSLNSGEGKKCLSIISSIGSGARDDDLLNFSNYIFTTNPIKFLPRALTGKITVTKNAFTNFDNVFGFVLLNQGHFIVFIREAHDGSMWSISDNEVGILHKITTPHIHFLIMTAVRYGNMAGVQTRRTSLSKFWNLAHEIQVDGTVYPSVDRVASASKFEMPDTPFKPVDSILFFEAPFDYKTYPVAYDPIPFAGAPAPGGGAGAGAAAPAAAGMPGGKRKSRRMNRRSRRHRRTSYRRSRR